MPLGEKMNRKFVLIMIAIAGLFSGGAAALAQNRPYDQVMKDIGATFDSLEQNLEPDEESAAAALDEESAAAALDEESAAAAVEDAAKLEGLFEEVAAFWAPFNANMRLIWRETRANLPRRLAPQSEVTISRWRRKGTLLYKGLVLTATTHTVW